MTAPSFAVEKARALVAGMWNCSAKIARLAFKHWPPVASNTSAHVAAAQFVIELEAQAARARADMAEDGRRRD